MKTKIERSEGELVTFHGNEAELLASYDVTDEFIKKLRTKFNPKKLPKDLEKQDDLVFVKSGAKEVQQLRLKVEERRKELKSDALKWGRMVDDEAKRITDALVEIEQPMKALVDAKNQADKERKERAAKIEAERVAKIKQLIADIEATYMACDGKDVEYVSEVIDRLKQTSVDAATFGEFIEEAQKALTGTLDRLAEYLIRRKDFEEREADLAIERAAQKKREDEQRAEREAFLKEKAEFEAQKREREELERKENEERERKAREAADEKAREKAMKESFNALKKFCADETQAGDILEAIVTGKIKHVTWAR